MADYVNPQNYRNMMDALNTFAAKCAETIESLETACSTCAGVLGDDDVMTPELHTRAAGIRSKYSALAQEARRIAREMQEELDDIARRERQAQQDTSADDDF